MDGHTILEAEWRLHKSGGGEGALFHGSPDLTLVIFPSTTGSLNLDSVVVRELDAILSDGRTGPVEVEVQALVLGNGASLSGSSWGR